MTEQDKGISRVRDKVSGEINTMKISPDILGISLKNQEKKLRVGPPNIWIIRGNKKAAIIDTGFGKPDEIRLVTSALEDLGNPTVECIVITHVHPDHSGGVETLEELTQARVVSGEAIGGLKRGMHRLIGEIDLGQETKLKIFKTPGHTAESIVVFDEKSRTLFTGDTIISSLNTVIVDRQLMGDYILSLRYLYRLKSSKIAPGHGHPVENPELKLRRMIEHRALRERQILELMLAGKTLEEIARVIYPNSLFDLGKRQIESQLFYLRKKGRII